jgi:hypothetical protein
MRKTSLPSSPLGTYSLSIILCCGALTFMVAAAAQNNNENNSNTGIQGNANNSNATGAAGGPQGNKNAAGGNQNANPPPATTTSPTPFTERPCGQGKAPESYPRTPNAQLSDLEVMDVSRVDTNSEDETKSAGLYNTICVHVKNLAEWVKAKDKKNDPSKFFLYLNTYPLKGVKARWEGGESDFLRFDLLPIDDKDTRENWRRVLSRPRLPPSEPRDVPISIGYEEDPAKLAPPIKSSAVLPLVVVNRFWFWVFAVSVVAAIALFLYLVFKSDLLRDDGPEPVGLTASGKPNRKPFSLGRSQMAFWFFIVIACYVFIWMVTSNGNTITGTALGLIGISAATALGSVMIKNNKDDSSDQRKNELEEERKRLTARAVELTTKAGLSLPAGIQPLALPPGPAPPALPAAPAPLTAGEQKELTGITSRLRDINQLLAGASRGFFTDILSDAGGVSFHRFQIVAWTLALGAIFLGQVFNYLLLPDFDSTLLALTGISAGTYLGFKIPEKQA